MKLVEGIYAFPWSHTQINNCNTYIVGIESFMLIDPGHASLFKHVEIQLNRDRIKALPNLVVVTHCHPDHMEAAVSLQKSNNNVKIAIHQLEADYLGGKGRQIIASLGLSLPEITFDIFLKDGELILGEELFQIIHTPGHSPGHICLYWPRYKALFTGDLIFSQAVGRVDFPGGSGEDLKFSIEKVVNLDLEWILPGHGSIIKGSSSIKKNFEFIKRVYFGQL